MLTKQEMLQRIDSLEWKNGTVRELARSIVTAHDDFVNRNRQEHFRGILLTLGQVFTEDNPQVQTLLLRPQQAVETISAQRLVRGSVQKPQPKPGKVRVFRMSEIASGRPSRETLLEKYPDMDSLRAFAREQGIRLAPSYKYVESAVDAVLEAMED